jgi:hypothetical protein
MPILASFTWLYNPTVDDYDAIVANAAPRILVGSTFLSPTAIRLVFASAETPAGSTLSTTLPPYIKPPKKH